VLPPYETAVNSPVQNTGEFSCEFIEEITVFFAVWDLHLERQDADSAPNALIAAFHIWYMVAVGDFIQRNSGRSASEQ
jgi:hypothetical protein